MRALPLDELDRRSVDVETATDATPGIDPWCSGPDWQIPAARAFTPDAHPLTLTTDDDQGFALLARYATPLRGTIIGGLEPMWGFGCPILGADPATVAAELADHLAADRDWRSLVLPGISLRPAPPDDPDARLRDPFPIPDDDPLLPVARALVRLGDVGLGEGIARQVVDLRDGYEAWLARRSPKFRRNLRRSGDRADDAGLTIVDASDDPHLFERVLAIEHRSWKGREGSGITATDMAALYRSLIDRLQPTGRLLAKVARLDHLDLDVGYILGGLRARRYRGLQLSFTAEVADLSVGNLLQAEQLRQLSDRQLADVYDLGMDFGYKRRWADRAETSLTLLIDR